MRREQEAPKPPDEIYVRQRWIPHHIVAWVKQCDEIMVKYGRVDGSVTYPTRDRARYPPRKLKRLMEELRLHEGWQMVEHTGRVDGGWAWSLEYIPREVR